MVETLNPCSRDACKSFMTYSFVSLGQRTISPYFPHTLGYLTWAPCQGMWGEKMVGRQGKRVSKRVGERGMGGSGVRRGVMECSGLERQAN